MTQYIRRNPDIFDGHIKADGKWLFIDEVAEKALNEKYPLPQPIEIVEDIETIKELSATRLELAKAEAFVIELQKKINETEKQIAIVDAEIRMNNILIEEKEKQIKEKEEALSRERERADQERSRADKEQFKADELQKELEKERNKTWWDKLRGR